MTPLDLKNSILQMAIQGKLVEQRAEEGTAETLYQQIQEEKAQLIKAGKIKKEKALHEITEDEIPFDIPESWKWVRLSTVGYTQTGNTPSKSHPEYFGVDIPFLGPGDIQNGIVDYDNQGLSNTGKQLGRVTPAESILQVCIGGSIGKCAIVDREVTFNQQINSIYPILAFSRYIYYVLDSSYFKSFMKENSGGTATPIINRGLWDSIAIPLPPVEEQKRIVTKICELLPLIDKYDKAWTKLDDFNKRFPNDMQKSILQMAIQGKLVEQRAEDGTAEVLYQQIQDTKVKLVKAGKIKKEKPLPEISEDEIPFDIPEGWKWVRLGGCGVFTRGNGIKKDEVIESGAPCVRYGQLYTTYKTRFSKAESHISEELFEKCQKVNKSDVLMALTGENNFDIALAVVYEGNEPVAMGGDMTKFSYHQMNPLYLAYVINSPYGIQCKSKLATGNIIVHISNDKLASIPIPLPPLKEQDRIVAKIEEMMPYCNKLKK